MIPIRDNIKAQRAPLINYLFITINLTVFFHELSLGDEVGSFLLEYGLVPWNMTRGVAENGLSARAHGVPWFSSMFMHGGWLHLIGNMWFLHIFGDNVEDRLGRLRYVVLFLSGGLVAALAHVISTPASTAPMVGASGAISAVVAAYLVCYPRARILTLFPIFILFFFARIPALLFIGVWFLIQLLYGYTALSAESAGQGVAWWAHIGGFGAGLVLALILRIGTTPRPTRELKGGRINLARGGWRKK